MVESAAMPAEASAHLKRHRPQHQASGDRQLPARELLEAFQEFTHVAKQVMATPVGRNGAGTSEGEGEGERGCAPNQTITALTNETPALL